MPMDCKTRGLAERSRACCSGSTRGGGSQLLGDVMDLGFWGGPCYEDVMVPGFTSGPEIYSEGLIL